MLGYRDETGSVQLRPRHAASRRCQSLGIVGFVGWVEDDNNNHNHPHSGLKICSPHEFIAAHTATA
jgi:hypothetical protein